MVSTCGPGLIAGLALSPLVAKAPLIASSQRKQSPSRGEIILLERLRKRRMRYLSPQTSDKHKDTMVIKDEYRHKQHTDDILPCTVSDQLGPNSDASILARQVIKKAKSRIRRRTKRRQSQPILSSPLQQSSSTISSSSSHTKAHHSPQAANHSKKPFHLPPITRSLSSSVNSSPDTSSSQFNKSPCSPTCKRALFTNPQQSFLTTIALSKPCSKDLVSSLERRKQHKSSIVQQHRRYIFLSEPRSPLCSDGSPGAPPASPRLDTSDSSVCYVLSLHDTKSQRTLKTRLTAMVREYKEKQEQQLIREKIEQQRLQKGRITLRKAQQRAEIYALNKIMTKIAETDFTANDDNKV